MKKDIFISCMVLVLLAGCSNPEMEFQKAKEVNTANAYRDYWAKYATTEYAEEAYFRASMMEGSIEALIEYLNAFKSSNWKRTELEKEACIKVVSLIEKKPTSEVLEIMSRANNSMLEDGLEMALMERDEETAWTLAQKILLEGDVDEKEDICKKYLKTYGEGGIHMCEMKQIVEYVLSEKELKEDYKQATDYRERSRIVEKIAENEVKTRLVGKPKSDASNLAPEPELKSPVRKKPLSHYKPHRALADSIPLPEL